MFGYILGTDTRCRGTFWVQKQKMIALYKTLYPLKCLASPDHTFLNVCIFPLCSYKAFWTKSRFRYFLQKFAPAGTKNRIHFLKDFMQNFSLHVDGQCLKIITGFAKNLWCEFKIYLFGSYLRFKHLYRILDIKLRKYLVFLQNGPLKLKIKALKIFCESYDEVC